MTQNFRIRLACLLTAFVFGPIAVSQDVVETKPAAPAVAAEMPEGEAMSMLLEGKIAAKPLAVFYARNVTPERATNYIKNVAQQLQIGGSIVKDLDEEGTRERLNQIQPQVADPLYGTAMYMVSGLIPSFESVEFQQVTDEDDARRLVNGRKSQWGENGHLDDLGNGCFRVQYRNQSSWELPEGADEKTYTNNSNYGQRGYQFSQKIVEKDGKKMVEHSQIMTNLFRYDNMILYEANFEDLFTMELPAAEELKSAANGSTDFGFQAYLDRVPQGIRQLGWTMLSSAVGSQLQQQDEESETTYNMRKSAGDLGLALVQTVLFDVDSADAFGKFATAEDDSLRAELRVRARNNSALSGSLLQSAGNSRFGPILSDDAAATLHLCVRLPEEAVPALQNTATWLIETMKKEHPSEPTMHAAGDAFAGVLNGLAEHRTLEFFVKAGWTQGSAGVFYGGIHVSDTPDLLQNLYAMAKLQGVGDADGPKLELLERDGIQTIVLQIPETDTEQLRAESGLNITHVYLAHQNSCLWIAAGTESAFDIIKQSVTKCSETSGAVRTPLISGRIDMQKWLSYPQDDPAHVTQLPHWLDENSWAFPPSPMMFVGFGNNQSSKPTPIMQRVFDLGGSQQGHFALEADEGGLLLTASLGEALANHMVVRMIDAQDSMMKESQRMIDEQNKKIQEEREKAKATQSE